MSTGVRKRHGHDRDRLSACAFGSEYFFVSKFQHYQSSEEETRQLTTSAQASFAELLLARHAILPKERLRDDPRQGLCKRLPAHRQSKENVSYLLRGAPLRSQNTLISVRSMNQNVTLVSKV